MHPVALTLTLTLTLVQILARECWGVTCRGGCDGCGDPSVPSRKWRTIGTVSEQARSVTTLLPKDGAHTTHHTHHTHTKHALRPLWSGDPNPDQLHRPLAEPDMLPPEDLQHSSPGAASACSPRESVIRVVYDDPI